MRHTIKLAGLAMLMACNNNPGNKNVTATSSHAAHKKSKKAPETTPQVNDILTGMNNMMHTMHNARLIGNNDIDFATMMLEHHKAAVNMSKVEIAKGLSPDLKAFAQKVIADQNKEIAIMQRFINSKVRTSSPDSITFQEALRGSMTAMMHEAAIIYNNIDKDFTAQMIPHHQGAVDMAGVYLKYGHEPELKALSFNIVTSQTQEINWLKAWFAQLDKK